MCNWPKEDRTTPPDQAAIKLSRLLTDSLGVEVSATKLYDLMRSKWSQVSLLAHAIHDEPARAQAANHHGAQSTRSATCPSCNGVGRV